MKFGHQCVFPDCRNSGGNRWANVQLCEEHFQAVKKETDLFYERKIEEDERYLHQQIEHLIPWSKTSLSRKSS